MARRPIATETHDKETHIVTDEFLIFLFLFLLPSFP
uniref:Uncharacterized protein n=1 Tax=Cucumis melo subsp. melo TaxID=412675 RepID=E5GCF2_CUCME|nr:hypothetical protein [Cucumis melo subsp. melo]